MQATNISNNQISREKN